MNNKRQENGTLTGPLIFTLPVFSLKLEWLDGTGWAAVFAKTCNCGGIASDLDTGPSKHPNPKHLVTRVVVD
jgi:hypothetical protein